MTATWLFTAEQLRNRFTLVLLAVVPFLFVIAAADALAEFSSALGGDLAADAATSVAAGWAAAFVSGALGFFHAASARNSDRRLSLAGAGPLRTAWHRVGAALLTSLVAIAASFAALMVNGSTAHPAHAVAGIAAFSLTYLGIGVAVGSLIDQQLEGSLIVTFIFMLDVFAGPAMTGDAPPWAISQYATELMVTAGIGVGGGAAIWTKAIAVALVSLVVALVTFAYSARRR